MSLTGMSVRIKEINTSPTVASRRRFAIMGLLFVTVVINYLDRSNLSIAAPSITSEFRLTPVQLGVVFSAFGWTYTPLQIPGGWLVDRLHPRVLFPLTIFFWSIATLCLGLSSGLVILIVLRMTVGLFEVPSFLINNRIATTWFGERERATCIAVYTSAEFVGLAFLTPLLAWLKVTFGWPAVFFFTGILRHCCKAFVFWRSYRDHVVISERQRGRDRPDPCQLAAIPDLSHRIATRHRERAGSLRPARPVHRAWPAQAVAIRLFRQARLGHQLRHSSPDVVSYLSGHLPASRPYIKAGSYASLPFNIGAFLGVLCSGFIVGLAVSPRLQPGLRAEDADHRRPGAVHLHCRRELRQPAGPDHPVLVTGILRQWPGTSIPLVAGVGHLPPSG